MDDLKQDLLVKIRSALQNKSITTPADPLIGEEVEDRKNDRALKRSYAWWFIGILIGQLLLMNLVFVLVGVGCLKFDQWSLNLYMGGTLAEVFGVILVITKNLFPNKK